MTDSVETRPQKKFRDGGPCRHFTGIQNDACRVGLSYKGLPRAEDDGNPRLPCVRLVDGKRWCDKWDGYSPDEMQAKEDAMLKETQPVLDAMVGIMETKQKSGSIPCPKCLGVLRFAHAPNGHVRARCDTPGCMVFMS